MKRGLAAFAIGLAVVAGSTFAGLAQAREPTTPSPPPAAEDPIAALLDNLPPDQSTDMDAEEAEAAAPADAGPPPSEVLVPMVAPPPKQDAAPTPPPAVMPAALTPPSPRSRLPQLDRPVMLGETGRRPDAPPSDVDIAYENRVRASSQSAQGLQGVLDGGWTVRGGDGRGLLALQIVDRGYGYMLEGAWRALDGGRVGLIDSLDRQTMALVIRITRTPGKAPLVLTLLPQGAGGWSGDIVDEMGSRPVTMRRN